MLRKYNQQRSFKDNAQLGLFTSIIAGMVNVSSLVLFFSFTSNITGHYAILAEEIANGNWFQVIVVLFWVSLYFIGSFISNFLIINSSKKYIFVAHSIPMILEMLCFLVVGFYGQFNYKETLTETEFLVSVLLFAMGLQNGLTASISNFSLKTTHLTGLTTDLAMHFSMLTKQEFRSMPAVIEKTKLLLIVLFSYLIGGVVAGLIILKFQFQVFYFISIVMVIVLLFDYFKVMKYARTMRSKVQFKKKSIALDINDLAKRS